MWYKGNVHTHTTKSDGDADPEVVVEWYKNHDYDFLVLSDHNHRTIIDGYSDALILIPTKTHLRLYNIYIIFIKHIFCRIFNRKYSKCIIFKNLSADYYIRTIKMITREYPND